MMAAEASLNSDAVWPAVMSKGILELCRVANAPDGLPLLQTYREYIVRPASSETQKGLAKPADANARPDSRSTGAVPVDSEAESGENPGQELAVEFTLRVTSFSADKLGKELFSDSARLQGVPFGSAGHVDSGPRPVALAQPSL